VPKSEVNSADIRTSKEMGGRGEGREGDEVDLSRTSLP
jgi:hypothetical protein